MAYSANITRVSVLVGLMFSSLVLANQNLTINEAVQVALERDALINVYQSRSSAFKEQAIAEDTLPDPKIKLGMMNLPTDTFSDNQEPMTQLQIGVQQMFPRGSSLEIKSQRATSMSVLEEAKAENQSRKVTRDVRNTWLELFYWLNAERVVNKNRNLFSKLVSVTKQQYAAGRQKQQDVIRSELELGMLDDRETQITTMLEMTRAKLEKFVGSDFSDMELESTLPVLDVKTQSLAWLENHPMMRMQQAMVTTSEKNVELAKQSYKPSWMLDLTYGKRENAISGAERANFISAMVKFDLPLFTGDRQDKKVAANKFRLNGAINSREERKRELTKMWQANLSKEKRLSQRIKQYKTLLVPKARENTAAALYSYQSGRSGFTALMRAQITELETQLKALRLKVDAAKSRAYLLYLTGENNNFPASFGEK